MRPKNAIPWIGKNFADTTERSMKALLRRNLHPKL
jgi:hypothetical protein